MIRKWLSDYDFDIIRTLNSRILLTQLSGGAGPRPGSQAAVFFDTLQIVMRVAPVSRRFLLVLLSGAMLLGVCAPQVAAQDGDNFSLPLFMVGNQGRANTYPEVFGTGFGFGQQLNNQGGFNSSFVFSPYTKEAGETNHAGNAGGAKWWSLLLRGLV